MHCGAKNTSLIREWFSLEWCRHNGNSLLCGTLVPPSVNYMTFWLDQQWLKHVQSIPAGRKYTLFVRGFYRFHFLDKKKQKNPMCVVQETRFFFWTIPKLLQKFKPYCITGGLIPKTLCNISSFSQTRNSNNAITSTLINNIIIINSETSEVISFKTLPQLSYVVYYGQLPPRFSSLASTALYRCHKLKTLSISNRWLKPNHEESTGMIYGTNCHITSYIIFSAVSN